MARVRAGREAATSPRLDKTVISRVLVTVQETVRRPGSRGPLPTGRGKQIGVRMHDNMLEPLDKWVSLQREKPSRSEAIRFILKDWFIAQGLMPPEPDEGEE